jgi:hypothetical protein
MLENLEPAPAVKTAKTLKPSLEFDGVEGHAVTPGYAEEPQNFDEFLRDAGMDPTDIDVIPPVRTSRWQRWDGEWLTSYRFTFRKKSGNIDLPLIMAEARKKLGKPKLTKPEARALVVLWSDLQVGKVDYRGDSSTLVARVQLMQARLVEQVKREKPEQVIFADLGDTIENFYNANSAQQAYSNDLSIMEQVDVATTLAWQTIRQLAELVPSLTYASVGSNHCQFRAANGKAIGKATDDWGVFIGRQLARLASETGANNVRFLEPQPHDESLAIDVFGDGFHILGMVHGHQASRPEAMGDWWRKQTFGRQPVADASLLIHGHWHHLRVQELGSVDRGDKTASRFIVMAPTMDNGSGWFKMRSGEDSIPGLATLILEKDKDFTGTVFKL